MLSSNQSEDKFASLPFPLGSPGSIQSLDPTTLFSEGKDFFWQRGPFQQERKRSPSGRCEGDTGRGTKTPCDKNNTMHINRRRRRV